MLSAFAKTCIFLSITNKNALERVARAATLLPLELSSEFGDYRRRAY